jgi:2-phospho-L-lactate transferase/gluconeogenesis factor (CofD/UPF0052 family)
MKILILTGGTGSIALQRGIHEVLGPIIDELEVKVLVNCYDNGLSTGVVRKVFDGKILGPSDVRKNQTTQAIIKGHMRWIPFLEQRFTLPASEAQTYCMNELSRVMAPMLHHDIVEDAIEKFFEQPMAKEEIYGNFSIANIVYAGLAASMDNSMRRAAKIMSQILGIGDNVLINSDESLFLQAHTRSGHLIDDEAKIVEWNNPNDKIDRISFRKEGSNVEGLMPVLCVEAEKAILEADVIILSSGTQWSSLIPTYESSGFTRAVAMTKAKIVMVMNRQPDKDMAGCSADEIIREAIVPFFPRSAVRVVMDRSAHPLLRQLYGKFSFTDGAIYENLSAPDSEKHDPVRLVNTICQALYMDYPQDHLVFDYDDSLVGRKNTYPKSSAFNLQTVNAWDNRRLTICTGNTVRELKINSHGMIVYAEGGVNMHMMNGPLMGSDLVRCLIDDPLTDAEVEDIQRVLLKYVEASQIHVRANNVMLTIKPVKYRKELLTNLTKDLVHHPRVRVQLAGKTSVEICPRSVSKTKAMRHLMDNLHPDIEVVYVGDELHEGNDKEVADMDILTHKVRFLHVRNPNDTALFLKAITT